MIFAIIVHAYVYVVIGWAIFCVISIARDVARGRRQPKSIRVRRRFEPIRVSQLPGETEDDFFNRAVAMLLRQHNQGR